MFRTTYDAAGKPNGVLRLVDGAFIPMDENNRDYQEYLKWVAEGNKPLEE